MNFLYKLKLPEPCTFSASNGSDIVLFKKPSKYTTFNYFYHVKNKKIESIKKKINFNTKDICFVNNSDQIVIINQTASSVLRYQSFHIYGNKMNIDVPCRDPQAKLFCDHEDIIILRKHDILYCLKTQISLNKFNEIHTEPKGTSFNISGIVGCHKYEVFFAPRGQKFLHIFHLLNKTVTKTNFKIKKKKILKVRFLNENYLLILRSHNNFVLFNQITQKIEKIHKLNKIEKGVFDFHILESKKTQKNKNKTIDFIVDHWAKQYLNGIELPIVLNQTILCFVPFKNIVFHAPNNLHVFELF